MSSFSSPYWNPDSGVDYDHFTFSIRRLDTAGLRHEPNFPEVDLPIYGFVLLTEGEILLHVKENQILVRPGELLIMPPHAHFRIDYYNNSVGYSGGFHVSILKDASYEILYTGAPLQQRFDKDDAAFINGMLARMYKAYTADPVRFAYIRSALDFLINNIRPGEKERSRSLSSRYLERVFDRSLPAGSVASVSAELGVAADRLTREVRKETGRTALEWIEISRINYAKQLLVESDKSVVEIADTVGIDDHSYFSRFFRLKTGFTPTAYRRAKRKPAK